MSRDSIPETVTDSLLEETALNIFEELGATVLILWTLKHATV